MRQEITDLLAGNDRHAEAFATAFDDLQDGQWPEALTVCCSDSRVLQDEMWDNSEPGRLFTVGTIGNRVVQQADGTEMVAGDVLYPLVHTGTEVAIVVGHTGCGAITATYDALTDGVSEPPGIEHCIELLGPHVEPGLDRLPSELSRAESVNRLVEYNVDRQIERLGDSAAVPDNVTAVGAVYDFQDVYGGRRGEIHVINVDGERSVDTLRAAHPEVAGRIRRLWAY